MRLAAGDVFARINFIVTTTKRKHKRTSMAAQHAGLLHYYYIVWVNGAMKRFVGFCISSAEEELCVNIT